MSDLVVLGIDGGGTKTRCVAINGEGEVLASCTVASTNINAVPHDAVRERLGEAIVTVLSQAGVTPEAVTAIGLGMSGVGRPADAAMVRGWIGEMLPGVMALVDNDAVAALASGTGGDLYGLVIISGTGMIVLGIDSTGKRRRAGGWGPIRGDPGGGFSIGMAILQAITAAVDGSGPTTLLTERVLHHLGLAEPQALIGWAYGQAGWAHIAGLAPLAERCAKQDDEVAFSILAWAADGLAQRAGAVIRGLGLENATFPIVLAGGNLRPGLLRSLLTARLEELAPNADVTAPYLEAAVGAALLALKQYWRQSGGVS
ncbi:MAG: ROK family protein [Caldilineaceae bacterium]|nr:ROK family protein [Caldilineaceae bacterium]